MSQRNRLSLFVVSIVALAAWSVASFSFAAHAGTLDDIRSRGKIVVAIDPTFAPYEYTDEGGEITGYDPAILERIAKELGVDVEYKKMAFTGIIPGLIAGSFDFTPTALNVTAERAERIDFTIPVSKSVNAILKRTGDQDVTSTRPEDLAGMTAAVKATTQPEQFMKQLNGELEAKGLEPVALLSLDTIQQTIAALVNKRVDFVVDDVVVLTKVMKERPEGLQIVGEIGPSTYISWGTRQSDDKLTAYIDKQISNLKETGDLQELQKKYLGLTFDLPESDFVPEQ